MVVTLTRRAALLATALAGLLAAAGAQALGSAAPFTPPSRAVPPSALPATEATPAAVADGPPQLTGLRLGRPSTALIDGAWVGLGDSIGGARLVALTPLGARLQHGDGRQEFLPLNPGIHFAPHPSAPAPHRGGRPAPRPAPMKEATP